MRAAKTHLKPLRISRLWHQLLAYTPLWVILTVPLLAQLLLVVSIVGYLSYRSGREAVEDLAQQLMEERSDRVIQNLNAYLQMPKFITQTNAKLVRRGYLDGFDLAELEQHFLDQMQLFPQLSTVAIANESGEFLSLTRPDDDSLVIRKLDADTPDGAFYRYWADEEGRNRVLQETRYNFNPKTDPPNNPWYQAARAQGNGVWRLVVALSKGEDSPALETVHFLPFYGPTGEFQGVMASGFFLTQVGDFLQQLQADTQGQIFLIERDGNLVATSTGELPFDNQASPIHAQNVDVQQRRLQASQSRDPLTRAAAGHIQASDAPVEALRPAHLLTFQYQQQRYFMQVTPLPEHLDWLMVGVIPESAFMDTIYANARRTAWLCTLALMVAIAMGGLTARWLVAPLRHLKRAAAAIARGQFDYPIQHQGMGEVAALAAAFRQMGRQLQVFFDSTQSTEQKFETLFNGVPIGVSVHNSEGQPILLNQAGQKILGREVNPTLTPDRLSEYYRVFVSGTSDLYPAERLPAMRALRGETAFADDLEVVPLPLAEDKESVENDSPSFPPAVPSDLRIPLEVQSVPVFDSTGAVRYVINAFQDISDRRRMEKLRQSYEQELERRLVEQMEIILQSETRFRVAVEQLPDMFALYDADRRFEYVNTKGLELSGKSLEEVLGKQDEELFSPHVTASYLPLLLRAVEMRSPQTGECVLNLPNSPPITAIVKYMPLLDRHGDINQILAITYDITQQKQAARDLEESEQRFRQIAETINQVFFIRSAQSGEFLYISPAYESIWGRTCESLYANPDAWLESVYPGDRPRVEQSLKIQLEGNSAQREYRIVQPNGSIRWIRAQVFAVRDNQGQVHRYAGLAQDITEQRLAEDAMRQSEASLRAFVEALPDLIIRVKQDGTRLSLWQGDSKVFHPHKCSVGGNIQDVLPQHLAQQRMEAIHRAITTQTLQVYAYQIEVEGELRYEEARVIASGSDEAFVIVRDITQTQQAAEALQRSEVLNRAILNAIPDLIIRMHRDGTYLDVKQTRAFPLIANAEPGRNVYDILPLEDARKRLAMAELALQTGTIQIYEFPLWIDGQQFWQEARIVPLNSEELLVLVRDLTERKQAEEALRESEERFRMAFDNAPIGIALISNGGQYLKVNQALCEITGYSEAELLTRTFQSITHPDDLNADVDAMYAMLAGKIRTYQVEKRYLHKQGHVVYVLLNVSLINDQHQEPLYFITQVQDISDRHQINRMKDEFISIVSHELRTPLTAIRGSLGILETGILDDDPDQVKDMLRIASYNSDRLVRLVNDILDLERLESGKVELVMQPCNTSDLIQQAVAAVKAIADEAGVMISAETPSIELQAAPDAVVQTLINLLSNAIKFSSESSMVWVRATLVDAHGIVVSPDVGDRAVLFSVKDDGRGIPLDRQESIFGRFQQVDRTDSRQKGGTGLGLAICRTIVQQHGGHIWVESALGKGSIFYFTLPLP